MLTDVRLGMVYKQAAALIKTGSWGSTRESLLGAYSKTCFFRVKGLKRSRCLETKAEPETCVKASIDYIYKPYTEGG